jgi:predicted deacylase
MIEFKSVSQICIDDLSPGRHRFAVRLETGMASGPSYVPVQVLVGSSPRPCLALVAGVHGDEYEGILALHEIARESDSEQLDGALLVIPVANRFAFAAGQRTTPQDGCDLNRVFPGCREGSLSERLAALLCKDLLSQADAVFTLHGATSTGLLSPWIEFLDVPALVGRASFEMAQASGFRDLMALDERPGRLLRAMGDAGVPLIEGEVGGRGATRHENVSFYKERVRAVAHHLGVMSASQALEPQAGHEPQPNIWRLGPSVTAPAAGVFLRQVSLRQAVRQGERLGKIVGLEGETTATVLAPVDGVVGGYCDHVGVQAGQNLVTLWTPAKDLQVVW